MFLSILLLASSRVVLGLPWRIAVTDTWQVLLAKNNVTFACERVRKPCGYEVRVGALASAVCVFGQRACPPASSNGNAAVQRHASAQQRPLALGEVSGESPPPPPLERGVAAAAA